MMKLYDHWCQKRQEVQEKSCSHGSAFLCYWLSLRWHLRRGCLRSRVAREALDALTNAPVVHDATVLRTRYQELDLNYLMGRVTQFDQDPAAPNTLTVNLFDDVSLSVVPEHVDRKTPEHFQLDGRMEGADVGQAVLIVKEGRMVGNIRVNEKLYQIRPVSGRLHTLSEINLHAFPDEHPEESKPGYLPDSFFDGLTPKRKRTPVLGIVRRTLRSPSTTPQAIRPLVCWFSIRELQKPLPRTFRQRSKWLSLRPTKLMKTAEFVSD